MNQQKIVSAILKDRNAWERIQQVLDPTDLSPEAQLLCKIAGTYYTRDENASACDTEIIKSQIEREVTSNKLAEVLVRIVDNLPDVSAVNLATELLAVKRHAVGLKLANVLTAGGSGAEELISQYAALGELTHDDGVGSEEPITGIPIEEIVAQDKDTSAQIKLFPKGLNERLDGGAGAGHHILIFARPEVGKTLVALNMVAGFLHQKLPVLYIGNEDPAKDIFRRLGSRLSGMNKYEIRENPKKARELIDSRAGDLFTIAPLAPGTFVEIGRLVSKKKPRVVILDQLRNIDVRSENRTTALERAATEARNLAKRAGVLVVSITQAGDSATGKRVLGLGDIDGSNTGIPAQVDVAIGVGADDSMLRENLRMFTLCKNKLGGNHDSFTVQIDPHLSKVIDL